MFKRIHSKLILTIGVLGVCAGLAGTAAAAGPIGRYTTKGAWKFFSAPKLHPPKLSTDARTQTSKLAPGYFMTAAFPNLAAGQPMTGQSGPLILDKNLQPVWFEPVPTNEVATNLSAQKYNGQPVLSWWQGVLTKTGATVKGEDVVVDQHYHTVAKLVGQDGWVLSEHEIEIQGTDAWVTAYKDVKVNTTRYKGTKNGVVNDAAVQEYDLKTGKLLYTWDALNPGGTANIPLSDSMQPAPKNSQPWDAYHVNSVQPLAGNEFLVSMRNEWAAYLVDMTTNKIVWTLGSTPKDPGSFKIAKNAHFEWQHDVRMISSNEVTLFDDDCCSLVGTKFGKPGGLSRGEEIKLNLSKHTAALGGQWGTSHKLNVAFLGSTEIMPDGNVVIGWGSLGFFSEYSKSGKLLLDAVWPGVDLSYRVLDQSWVGIPTTVPNAAVRTSKGKPTVYASWNGATQVAKWKVLAGTSSSHLKAVATANKKGFETSIKLSKSYGSYEVEALDSHGHTLGTSKVVK
jgi:hypothetical protein